MADMVEAEATRVMNVGVGVFCIGFFGIVCLLACCIGQLSATPDAFTVPSTLVFAIVLIILLASEKAPRYVSTVDEQQVKDYDSLVYTRVAIFVIMVVSAIGAAVGVLITHAAKPLHAHPIYETNWTQQGKLF